VFNVIGTSIGYASGGMLLKLKADIEQPTSFLSNKGGEQFGAWVSYLQKKKFFCIVNLRPNGKPTILLLLLFFCSGSDLWEQRVYFGVCQSRSSLDTPAWSKITVHQTLKNQNQ
jgi:hypothetical protein